MSNFNKNINDKEEKENSDKNSQDLMKTNLIKAIDQISQNNINKEKQEEDKKEKSASKNIMIQRLKSLKKTLIDPSYRFLNYLGKTEQAKIHREANSPLKRVGEIDENTRFCKCCNLPCITKDIIEEYKYSDSRDDFIQNGQAIPLYFSFYIYSIFILIIIFLSIALPCLIISYGRSSELNKVCNRIYKKIDIEECKIYIDHHDNIEDENKSSFSFILDFSGLNIKNFRKIHQILSSIENEKLEGVIVNYSILNFICIWAILLIYFGYLILINNKNYIPNINILNPKNYSIMITGMDKFYTFLKNKTIVPSVLKNFGERDENEDEMKQSSERETTDGKFVSKMKRFEYLFEQKISEIFYDEKQKFNIKKVNVCFKINKYIELYNKSEKYDEILNLQNSNYQKFKNSGVKESEKLYYYSPLSDFDIHICERSQKISDVENKKKKIDKEINELLDEAKNVDMQKFAGSVIVTFNTVKEKEEFLSHLPNSWFLNIFKLIGRLRYFLCFCCIDKIESIKFINRNLKLSIKEAPNPDDIIFENLEFSQQSRTYRVVGINMISLILIAIGFAIILGLEYLQVDVQKKDYNKIVYFIISICIAIVSSIINAIFEEILDILTEYEKQRSYTDYYLSYSIKLTIFSFLTKGIMPLVADIILGSANHEHLVTNMLIIFLSNSIITPLIWTFNITPIYWINKLKICLIEKNEAKYLNMNQKKLNKLYEKRNMNIAEKYSYIAKTLLMTFLYISIFPFGVLISLGGFIICYFLEKYNFINNYKRPEVLNNSLFFFYMRNYVIFIFFIGIGDYIFLSDVYNTKGWSIVNIIFSGVLIVIPFNYLLNLDFIGFKESEINKVTYDDAFFVFNEDYERSNPMTEIEGKINYLEKLSENDIISKEEKDNFIKDIKNINLMKIYYQNRKMWGNKNIRKSLVSSIKKNLNLSQNPNTKNILKISSIYNSFAFPNMRNKIKINLNQNADVINEENNKEDEKESVANKIEVNEEMKKNMENKNQKNFISKSYNKGSRYKKLFNDPIMFNICGSFAVYDYLARDKKEKEDDKFFENEGEFEQEDIESKKYKNIDNIGEIECKIYNNEN